MAQLQIDIWSDVACPWCYVGKRRLESALAAFPHAQDVAITWHAFELDPGAPAQRDGAQSQAERLAQKYRKSVAEAQAMLDHMTGVAKTDGIEMKFAQVKSGNTFDAHRLIHLGTVRGKGDAVKEHMLRAYFTDGIAIGDRDALAAVAVAAGLDEAEVKEVLSTNRYADEVRGDEALARELGIRGVPFFVFDKQLAVSGAQPAAVLRGALDQAWGARDAAAASSEPDGAVCGPDGCA